MSIGISIGIVSPAYLTECRMQFETFSAHRRESCSFRWILVGVRWGGWSTTECQLEASSKRTTYEDLA